MNNEFYFHNLNELTSPDSLFIPRYEIDNLDISYDEYAIFLFDITESFNDKIEITFGKSQLPDMLKCIKGTLGAFKKLLKNNKPIIIKFLGDGILIIGKSSVLSRLPDMMNILKNELNGRKYRVVAHIGECFVFPTSLDNDQDVDNEFDAISPHIDLVSRLVSLVPTDNIFITESVLESNQLMDRFKQRFSRNPFKYLTSVRGGWSEVDGHSSIPDGKHIFLTKLYSYNELSHNDINSIKNNRNFYFGIREDGIFYNSNYFIALLKLLHDKSTLFNEYFERNIDSGLVELYYEIEHFLDKVPVESQSELQESEIDSQLLEISEAVRYIKYNSTCKTCLDRAKIIIINTDKLIRKITLHPHQNVEQVPNLLYPGIVNELNTIEDAINDYMKFTK